MKIEFLYFDECPNHHTALAQLKAFLSEKGDASPIEIIRVENDSDATRHRFAGSPTIRFNGVDILPSPQAEACHLGCRVYQTSQGLRGVPSREMLEEAYAKADR